MQTELGQDANAVIIEILESYMEFVDITENTLKKCTMPPQIKTLAGALIARRRLEWKPILEKAKQEQTKGGNK